MGLPIHNNVMALSLPGSTEPQSQLLSNPALYFIGQLVISAVVAFVASRSAAYGAFVLEVLGVVVFLCYTACVAADMHHQDPHFDLKHAIDFIYSLLLFLLFRYVVSRLKKDGQHVADESQPPNDCDGKHEKHENKSTSTFMRLRIHLGTLFAFDFDYVHEKDEP